MAQAAPPASSGAPATTPSPGSLDSSGASASSAGQRIATQGDPGKGVVACVTCHGAQGEGIAATGFPRLGGQSAVYLHKQLDSYANGLRRNPIMEPIAKGLSEADRKAVSDYYATLAAPATAAPAPGDAAATRADTLYRYGDESRHIQGCVNCHGPGGAGEGYTYPALAGQHAGYLDATLHAFKDGSRNSDESQQMPYIARQLSDDDIAALSSYLAHLPPGTAPDAGDTTAIRQRAIQGAGTPSAPQAGPAAPAGIGTEQGAPLTGGSQGPGGGGGGSGSGPSGSKTGH